MRRRDAAALKSMTELVGGSIRRVEAVAAGLSATPQVADPTPSNVCNTRKAFTSTHATLPPRPGTKSASRRATCQPHGLDALPAMGMRPGPAVRARVDHVDGGALLGADERPRSVRGECDRPRAGRDRGRASRVKLLASTTSTSSFPSLVT